MGGALRIDLAAEWAGTALNAPARVPADRPAARPEGRRPFRAELAVPTERLEVQRRHREHLLGGRVERIEVTRPLDALAVLPLLEDLRWRAEAGPRVDHRGASKGPADRNRDGGLAHGDRHPP